MSAAVVVAAASAEDRPGWDTFVASSPGAEAGHDWKFLDAVREVFRLEVFRLVARRGGACVGVLPLVFQRSVLGRFLTSVPYLNYAGVLSVDPEARLALAGEALHVATELRVDRLEIRGRDGSDLPIDLWEGKATYSLDLSAGAEKLWAALGSKLRAQVKRPGKEGCEVTAPVLGGRALFYPLLARRFRELGSPVQPERFFESMESCFGVSFEYVAVLHGGKPAAVGALLRHRDTVEIPWAASAGELDRVGVNMLLYWAAIERAAITGATRFDFGRSTPGSGNARFKKQWGAIEAPLGWNVNAAGKLGRANERGDRRRGLAGAVWRRLPAFVADRLGPLLAARIPY